MLIVTDDNARMRLDQLLARTHSAYSRAIWQKLIEEGRVEVNNELKPVKYLVKSSDEINFNAPEPPDETSLPIIYEDDDVIVINKPAGLITHLKSDLESEPSVAGFIASQTTAGGGNRAGIVHRLDRATSGIIVTAKNETARSHLSKQFSNRNLKKWYLSVIEGAMSDDKLTIDKPISRNNQNPSTLRASDQGKPAKTIIYKLAALDNQTLVLFRPITGRTHQLRVHAKSIDHPIIGDLIYGKEAKSKASSTDIHLLLHAWQLELTLPNSERRTFIAEIPDYMSKYIDNESRDTAAAIIASTNSD